MEISEQVVLQMARDKVAQALRAAEVSRALADGPRRRRPRIRVRAGSALMRLGRWIAGGGELLREA